MFQRFITISLSTFVETIRQPIFGVLLLVTALLSILNVSLSGFTLDNDDKLLLDVGLSTLLLSGLFLAAFSATGVISREIENKTVLTVISKPIGRPVFILGKFGGLFAAMLLAFYLCFLVFLLCMRHGVLQTAASPWDGPVLAFGFGALFLSFFAAAFCNYFYGANFSTTVMGFVTPLLTLAVIGVGFFSKKWEVIPFGSSFVDTQVMVAAYLVFLAVVIVTSIAVAASTRCGQVMTLAICTVVLGVGIISDHTFGQHAGTNTLAAVAYRIVPNIGPFWVIDGLTTGSENTTVTPTYVAYTTAYAALLTTSILSIAVAAFQKREVG
jgi:ABC-type transport system involved in multi-copper enzyme maturation permease subunit